MERGVAAAIMENSMEEELNTGKGTWTLVPDKGQRKIKAVWPFKVKRDEPGRITKLKSGLNAAGYYQREGIDYKQCFAFVGKKLTFLIVMALAAKFRCRMRQADFESAFHNGMIDVDLYM